MARPLDLAKTWHREGLLSDEALAKLETRYATDDELSPLTVALLGGAAIVLAAAVIAFPVLLDWERAGLGWAATIGALIAAAGAIGLWFRSPFTEHAEALGVTSLALLVVGAGAFLEDTSAFAWTLGVVALGLIWLPQKTVLIPGAAVLVAGAGLGIGLFNDLQGDPAVTWLFLIALAVSLAILASRFIKPPGRGWQHGTASLFATGGAIALGLSYFFEVVGWQFQGAPQLWVAMIAVPLLLFAFYVRDRSALLAAVVAIAIDAVVFGFDLGSLYLGIPMLLAVCGGLVALAYWAQRSGVMKADERKPFD